MPAAKTSLSSQIIARAPLDAGGASGNTLERVTLQDGRRLVCKRVSPEWDWLSRATGDQGRALTMWSRGLFTRMPASIEHAMVAVEGDTSVWAVFMKDVSDALLPHDRRLDRASLRQVLSAMADLHLAFWGEDLPDLCDLTDRYHLLSPRTAERETQRGNEVGPLLTRCWEAFREMVPRDLGTAILAFAERPELLAAQLGTCEQTLIHGDLRLANLGLRPDRVVLVDWGERTGPAPAAVELASFLVFDARRFDVSKDDVLADFRALYRQRLGDRYDERALQLALIGALVQLGCHLVLDIVLGGGEDARAVAVRELAWWTPTVTAALESSLT